MVGATPKFGSFMSPVLGEPGETAAARVNGATMTVATAECLRVGGSIEDAESHELLKY